MNYSFSILFTSITIGVHQKETKRKCLVQHTSERSNRLWKTTELFMEFCRDACRESRKGSSNLCSSCSYNRWVGPETERIPQPVPDPNNPGHFMDVYQTELRGRTPDDYLPRKCLKDLYDEHSDSIINDRDTIKNFCTKYNVDQKHVITYVNHLKDIDIRKDIRTRVAEERRRQEAERTPL